MKKNRKKLIFIFLILIIFAIILKQNIRKIVNNEEILKQIYGEPIGEDGTINNSYFGIEINGKNAKDTLDGINKALEYANKKNIENVKLEKGTYIIDSQTDPKEYHYQEKGITLKSNIKLDLNGSTIKHIANNRPSYSLISIIKVENVEISNGILEGDRKEHIFTSNRHQFGHGIDIAGSKNLNIHDLEIINMIGDGIYVSDISNSNKELEGTQNVKINNCNIYNCRRQGISIIIGDNIEIFQNEIHNISGSDPQTCIDLETGNKENAIRNIKIYNNKLYSAESKRAIVLSKNVYETSIWANEIEGQIRTYNAENEINIYNNMINNGGIIGVLSESNIEDEKYYVKKIHITNNVLKNAYISLGRLNDSIIEKNEIENGYISVENMNSAVFNNKIINSNDTEMEYAISYINNTNALKKYNIFSINNNIIGKFKELQKNGENLEITDNYNQMQNYINKFNEKK